MIHPVYYPGYRLGMNNILVMYLIIGYLRFVNVSYLLILKMLLCILPAFLIVLTKRSWPPEYFVVNI